MSRWIHEWCREVLGHEQARAAEDAAAVPSIQHRDLPEVVADLRERVARLMAAQAAIGSGDEIARLTAERDAAIRERDETLLVLPACCGRLSDAAATVVQERDHARSRVAELLADCDTFERAALALQGQLDRALARVAELEAAPPPRGWLTERESAAVTDGGPDATAGPVAWALAYAVCGRGGRVCDVKVSREEAEDMQREFAFETELVPLYNAPQRPRSWLTAAERAQVQRARDELLSGTDGYDNEFANEKRRRAGVLTALLARSTPPRVKLPPWHFHHDEDDAELNQAARDKEWIAAIRDAGGEVD